MSYLAIRTLKSRLYGSVMRTLQINLQTSKFTDHATHISLLTSFTSATRVPGNAVVQCFFGNEKVAVRAQKAPRGRVWGGVFPPRGGACPLPRNFFYF